MGKNIAEDKLNIKNILKTAGAFIAWVIGSGFATGQEILRFFASFGCMAYGVVLINFIGFILLGYILMKTGFENKDIARFNHFNFFCGRKLGTLYNWLITATLMLLIPVLISGGGATLYEYYGINHYIGSAIMTGAVLTAYLIGFERLINIVSSLGPLIIVFSLLVGTISLVKGLGHWQVITSPENILEQFKAAPHWALSGLIYLGLTFFGGSAYYTQLGRVGISKRDLKYGAVLGGSVLVLSITIMTTAIILNGQAIAGLDIPVLYLAGKMSYVLGAVFSIMLVLGIFSSCSLMMWSVCSRFTFKEKKWNSYLAIAISIVAYLVSLLSFGTLIGTIYPMIGYVGLIFIGCVLYGGISKMRSIK